ncbi:MAG: Gfo/Idh/MocA family oxidoreductase [Dehalococcoidales bacterium]|nr:Gfo/Idh/MocA family oxidoreductase [Dehalococcoidales bacterium]
MSGILKVAVIGTGAVANDAHFPSWRKIPGISIIAVCDVNKIAAENTARRWQIPHSYTDINELLKAEKPDIVDICTPPNTHLSIIEKAFETGCHVTCEKPLAMNLEETCKIEDLYKFRANKANKFNISYSMLYHPQMLALLRKLVRKDAGEILNVDIRCLHPVDEEMLANPKHWCHTLPGGRLGETIIHPIYMLYKICGNLQLKDVYIAKRGPYNWVNYDELRVTFDSERGFAGFYVSFNSPGLEYPLITIDGMKRHIMLNGHNHNLVETCPTRGYGIFSRGTDSLIQMSKIAGSLIQNTVRTLTLRHKNSHQQYFELFVDNIKNNNDMPVNTEDAFAINRIFLSVLERIS